MAVFVGGGLGSLARYGISTLITTYFKTQLPVATLLANALSCVVFGVALLLFSSRFTDAAGMRLLVLVGFCGGFSTFSTFSYETLVLLRTGQQWAAFANAGLSMALCLALLYLISKF